MPKEIIRADISFVSLVAKGANREKFFLLKSEDASPPNLEKEIPIIAKSDEKQIVYGVVYSPDTVDTQGDFMKAETIEKACHDYMEKSQSVDKNHSFKLLKEAKVVESYIAPCDMTVEGAAIKKGAWVMATKVSDAKLWEAVKKGEINAYSIGGTGERIEVKEEVKKEAADSEELSGFFNVLKSFFTGDKIEKAVKVKGFAQTMTQKEIIGNTWEAMDALRDVMREIILNTEITAKKSLLNKAIDEYSAYMKSRVSQIEDTVTKADKDFFAEPVEKAGRKISGKNVAAIREAVGKLNSLLEETEMTEEKGEETEMTKQELEEVMKSAMKPVLERVEKLEKEDNKELTKEDYGDVIAKAIEPLIGRIDRLEKSRNISKQLEGQEQKQETVKKNASGLAGYYGF